MKSNACPVCISEHIGGAVLQHGRPLATQMADHEFMGFKLCNTHQGQYDIGNVTVIEVLPEKCIEPWTPITVFRTGRIAFLPVEFYTQVTGLGIPPNPDRIAFCAPEPYEQLVDVCTQLKKAVEDYEAHSIQGEPDQDLQVSDSD